MGTSSHTSRFQSRAVQDALRIYFILASTTQRLEEGKALVAASGEVSSPRQEQLSFEIHLSRIRENMGVQILRSALLSPDSDRAGWDGPDMLITKGISEEWGGR